MPTPRNSGRPPAAHSSLESGISNRRHEHRIIGAYNDALSSLKSAIRNAPTPQQLEGMKHHPLFDAALKSTFARSAFAFVLLVKAQLTEQSGRHQVMTPDDARSCADKLLKCTYDWNNRTDECARCFRAASGVLQLGRHDDQVKVLIGLLRASTIELHIKLRYESDKEFLRQCPTQLKDFEGHIEQSRMERVTEEIKSRTSECTRVSEDAKNLVKGSRSDKDMVDLKKTLKRIEKIADSNYIREQELKLNRVHVKEF